MKYFGKLNVQHGKFLSIIGDSNGNLIASTINKQTAESIVKMCNDYEKLERMFRNLFDVHYGTSYHHCGDGDGLKKENAEEMINFMKNENSA